MSTTTPPVLSTRRRLLQAAVPAALAVGSMTVPARPAVADLPSADLEAVAAAGRYFESLRTLRARFQQIAPNGESASGMVYLERPGRMRFDYDPPAKILLIATDWRLIFQDSSVKQINVIPVRETPLGFLLADHVSLTGDITVTQVVRGAAEIGLRVIRTEAPDQGSVLLYLARQPMELRRWSVTDAQGLTTQILLLDLETNIPLDPKLFRWRDPQLFGWPEG